MDRTVEISFFDPRAIDGEKLDVNIVIKVELIVDTQEYRVTYKDGSSKLLPSTIPLDSVMIQSAEMVGDDLIIHLDNGEEHNIGRIATVPTFDDITPVGVGVLMPGSKTNFKELAPTGNGLTLSKTADAVSLTMAASDAAGFIPTDPGEIDFTDVYIGERFTTDVYDMGSSRTWYVDDLTGLAENAWHDYVFTRAQLDTLGKYANGTFSLTAGQYYIDFHINLLAPASFNLRLQDVTNDVTLMQGTVVSNEGTYILFSSFTSDIVGDFILPAAANVKVQFKWTGGDAKRVISPTRVNAVTDGCVGGQIFLSKIAPFESVVEDVPSKPMPTTTAVAALRTMLAANPQYTLEVLPPVGGDGLETHATLARYQSKLTSTNGLTYLIPASASKIAVYDPASNEAHRLNYDKLFSGTLSFCGGAVDSEGRAYLSPCDHNEFLRIIPQTEGGWDRTEVVLTGAVNTLPQFTSNISGTFTASANINNADAWKAFDSSTVTKWECEIIEYTTEVVIEQSLVTNKSSNADQGVISSASTINNATTEAWRCLTGTNVYNEGWITSGAASEAVPQWIEVEFQSGNKTLSGITIHNRKVDAGQEATKLGEPQDFRLDYWNPAQGSWVNLLTVTGRMVGNGGVTYHGDFPNNRSTRFRLTITKTTAGAYTSIGLLQFHTKVYDSGLSRNLSPMLSALEGNQAAYANNSFDAASAGWVAFSDLTTNAGWKSKDKGLSPLIANNQPANQVYSASGLFSSDYGPWRAFDGLVAERSWISGATLPTTPQWLQVAFTDGARRVTKYSITNRGIASDVRAPKDWTFEGRETDTDAWTVLDTVVNNANLGGSATTERTLATPSTYSQYRINITAAVADGASSATASITEFKLFNVLELIPAELGVEVFDSLVTVTGYSMENKTLISGQETPPKSWEFQGRNKSTEPWVTLHVVSDHAVVANNTVTEFSGLGPFRYKQFRWNITSVIDTNANRLTVGRLRLLTREDIDTSQWTSPVMSIGNAPMASLSEGGQTVSASSGESTLLKAFDGVITDASDSAWISAAKPTIAAPQWLQVEFAIARNIIGYRLTNRLNSALPAETQSPKSWKLQGKMASGDTWIDLQTISGYRDNKPGAMNAFQLPVGVTYKIFRLCITDANGANDFVSLGALELVQQPDPIPQLSLLNSDPVETVGVTITGDAANPLVTGTLECNVDGEAKTFYLTAVNNKFEAPINGVLSELTLKDVVCNTFNLVTVNKVELTSVPVRYDLLGPGLVPASPQMVITGTPPVTGWGDISTTLLKNRGSADTLRYKSAPAGSAEFTFELDTPEVIQGISLTNLTTAEVTGFEVHGLVDGGTEYAKIADVDIPIPDSSNLIKVMNANVSAGQTVTTNSNYIYGGHEPYKAFTAIIQPTGWVSALSHVISEAAPVWLEIDLGKVVDFNSYSISNRDYTLTALQVGGPKDFKLQGYDTESGLWVDLHQVVNRTDNVAGSTATYDRIGEHSYQRVRIYITGRNPTSSNNYVGVGKLELRNKPKAKVAAVNATSTALYKAIKLIITKGKNFIPPNDVEFNPIPVNLIRPMTGAITGIQKSSASSSFSDYHTSWNAFGSVVSGIGWVSGNGAVIAPATPAWLQIDLGKSVNFDSVNLANRAGGDAASPKDFKILGYNNITSAWDVIHTVTGRALNTPGAVSKYTDLGNLNYQIVRIEITAAHIVPGYNFTAIGKIELYKNLPSLVKPMTADVSAGQVASASGSIDGTALPWNAFTGAISWGGWVSPNSGAISPAAPVWVAIDLGKPVTFDSYLLANRGYNAQAGFVGSPKDFKLQGWNSATNLWEDVHSVANRTDNVASSTTYYHHIGKFTYQKVRLLITAKNATTSGAYVCVGQLQLFNAGTGGGIVGIEKLEIITPEPKDLTLPYGYVEKIGNTTTALNKWRDAVYCPVSNKILFIPFDTNMFMVYDVTLNKFFSTNFGLPLLAAKNSVKAVYNPINNLVYVASAQLGYVSIIDLIGMRSKVITVTRPTVPVNNTQWSGAFVGVDGRVFFCPCYGTEWLVICPTTGAYWLENFGEVADVTKQGKGMFGAYGADGRYYVCDWATANNNLGLDTLNLTKQRVVDPLLTKLTWANFTDKFGNVYLLNGVSENNLIRLNFGLTDPIHPDLLTGQFN